jgi:hypothetical protein
MLGTAIVLSKASPIPASEDLVRSAGDGGRRSSKRRINA